MKDSCKFDTFDPKKAIQYSKEIAGEEFTDTMAIVITIAFSDIRNLPSLRFPEGSEIILKDYMAKWTTAFLKGYNNRPSLRNGNESNTYSDPIVKLILQARLSEINDDLAGQLAGGHSLMMTIENLVGDLLEEYLSIKLAENGWCCCWGSTIDAVDFCKADGSLIQIKNSDNSENSSSSRVRVGTTITKWYRRKSTKDNTFFWKDLNQIVKRNDLTEDDFRAFVQATIIGNPNCLFVDPNDPLNNLE